MVSDKIFFFFFFFFCSLIRHECFLGFFLFFNHTKMYLLTCASNEDSNQPVHPCRLASSLSHEETVHSWLAKWAQWRFWSDSANAQADLNLRWAHTSENTFSDIVAHIFTIKRTQKVHTYVFGINHYENTPIQIYWKFHHQKPKVFRLKIWYFSYFCSKQIVVLVRTASPRRF